MWATRRKTVVPESRSVFPTPVNPPLNQLYLPLTFSSFAPLRTPTIVWSSCRTPPSETKLPTR